MSKIYTLEALQMESIITPKALKQELLASPPQLEFVYKSRKQVEKILKGEDPRLLLIVGPCSIHDNSSAIEYASKLRLLSDALSDHFFIVMRTYFEKSRTSLGWKGVVYDPHLNGTNDIATGLRHARSLLLELADLEIPAATEFLDPFMPKYFGDLISWACIGARTTESQIHRQFASGLPMPVGFKNGTSGNVDVALNAVLTASHPHTFFSINDDGHLAVVNTKGNPHSHIVLRGGEGKPNYDPHSIASVIEKLKKSHLPSNIIVDCSHDNSSRKYEEQCTVFKSVLKQHLEGNTYIRGLALESNLFAGSQPMPIDKIRLQYAVSITDPCLDWASTEKLIRWGADQLVSLDQRRAVNKVPNAAESSCQSAC